MKPRTKREKLVAKLSKKLGGIGKRDEQKLLSNTYGPYSYDELYNRCYAVINQSYQGWQVLRYFRISRRGKQNISYTTWEVMQLWSKQGEGQVVISRKRCLGLYLDTFVLSSDMEIRRPCMYQGNWMDIPYMYLYNKSIDGIYADIEPVFSEDLDNVEGVYCNRRKMYELVAKTNFPDTFIKSQPSLFAYAAERGYNTEEYITAFKIAMRHHYHVEQPDSYIDYLNALVFLGKDIHNPFYVCPEDFKAMHDKYITKMQAVKDKQEEKERAEKDAAANEKYQARRKQFFDLFISNGKIECHVLQSVGEFYAEGKAMRNCVYKCGYYKKPYSVIFSARIDGKRVETVEFDLGMSKVVQAYGKCNEFSKYHDEIVKLVNANADRIQIYNNRRVQLNVAV